jgi:hypothetical protein
MRIRWSGDSFLGVCNRGVGGGDPKRGAIFAIRAVNFVRISSFTSAVFSRSLYILASETTPSIPGEYVVCCEEERCIR